MRRCGMRAMRSLYNPRASLLPPESSPSRRALVTFQLGWSPLSFSTLHDSLGFHGALDLLSHLSEILLHLLAFSLGLALGIGQTATVHQHPRGLGGARQEQEEVDGGEEDVLRTDDEAPAGPDEAGGHEGGVCVERKLGGGACEVRGTGDDETPFHDGSPEVQVVSIVLGFLLRGRRVVRRRV